MARLLRACLDPDPAARPRSVREILALTEGRISKAMDPATPLVTQVGPSDFTTPAAAPPEDGGGIRLLPATLLVALGLFLGFALRSGTGTGTDPIDSVFRDAPTVAPRSGTPFGTSFVASVRDELEDAVGSFRDLDGRKFKPAPGTSTVGLTLVLDPDPVKLPRLVGDLPSIALFHRWIAQGNQPERLPDELREALREIDRSLNERELPPLFEPFSTVVPATEAIPPPPELAPYFPGNPAPLLSGWAGAAVGWFKEAKRLASAVDDDLRRASNGALPDRFPETLAKHIRFIPASGLEDLVEAVQASPDYRTQMARWLGPGSVLVARLLYCTARSLREEPATREALALAVRRGLGELQGFCHGHFVRLDPEVVLGGKPASPAGWWLQSGFLYLASRAARTIGEPSPALFERELEALQEAATLALSAEPGAKDPDQAALQRQASALVALVERSCAWVDRGHAASVWRSNLGRLSALPDKWTYQAWCRIGDALVRTTDRVDLEPHEIEDVATWLASRRGGVLASSGPWVDDLVVKLRSRLPR